MTDLERIVGAFDPTAPQSAARTPPASWYRSPELAALERRTVFRSSWQLAARVGQLAHPGDYVATLIAGEPVLVLRDADDTLRAFDNVCRHKATQLVTGCGRVDALTCPYHGWRYGLDGSLLKAPRLGRIDGFDRGGMGLKPLRLETWGPFVFVCADPATRSLAPLLAPLGDRLERSGWNRLVHRATHSWDVACNWKVFCDNYLDGGYHIANLHPSLDAQLDGASYRTELFEGYSVQSCPPAAGRDDRVVLDPRERIEGGALYAFLYPNFMLNRYGPALDINHVLPLGPERCRVTFEFYFEPDCDPEFVAASIEQSDLTQREDIGVSESVQIGLGSSRFEPGPYAAPEIAVQHFHRLLASDLRLGLSPR